LAKAAWLPEPSKRASTLQPEAFICTASTSSSQASTTTHRPLAFSGAGSFHCERAVGHPIRQPWTQSHRTAPGTSEVLNKSDNEAGSGTDLTSISSADGVFVTYQYPWSLSVLMKFNFDGDYDTSFNKVGYKFLTLLYVPKAPGESA
jgi:hypothetical protein